MLKERLYQVHDNLSLPAPPPCWLAAQENMSWGSWQDIPLTRLIFSSVAECVNCNISVNEKYCDRMPMCETNGLLNRYEGKMLFSKNHLRWNDPAAWAGAVPASPLGFWGRVITLSSGRASIGIAIIQCYHSLCAELRNRAADTAGSERAFGLP